METTINQRFIEAFKWTELTSNGLATLLGINAKSVWNYTTGKMQPNFRCVSLLCKQFPELSFDYIWEGKGNLLLGTPVANEDTKEHDESSPETIDNGNDPGELRLKLVEIYEKAMAALEKKLSESNKRCALLEEQNKILKDLIEENNKCNK